MVILDPTRGANKRDLVCPRCSQKNGSVILGIREYAGICNACKMFNVGLSETDTACQVCKSIDIKPKRVPPNMPLPKLCDACLKELAGEAEVLKAGGIFWQCLACGSTGMLGGCHPLAIATRKQAGVVAPNPCGVKFDKTSCPVCCKDLKLENPKEFV